MTPITAAVTLILAAVPDEPKKPPSKPELAAITRRSRDLAGYDAAASHASDALFQSRRRGEPAEVVDWADRDLPAPTALTAYAAAADAESFAATWSPRAEAFGIEPDGPLTVVADGAEWIWRAAGQFPAAEGVQDIFHAVQHLAATAAALHGEGTAEASDLLERGRRSLLADGWPGLLDHIGATTTEALAPPARESVDGLIASFAKHTDRLGYYGRLRTGRSIGSGSVEGLARRMGRRLRVPDRGWRVQHLVGWQR